MVSKITKILFYFLIFIQIFSHQEVIIKMHDFRYTDRDFINDLFPPKNQFRSFINLKYTFNDVLEIEMFENLGKNNLLKVSKKYYKLTDKKLEEILLNITDQDIKRISKEEYRYHEFDYIAVENFDLHLVFLGRGNKRVKKENDILYDIFYKYNNFIISDYEENYEGNMKELAFYIADIIDRIDCDYNRYCFGKYELNREKLDKVIDESNGLEVRVTKKGYIDKRHWNISHISINSLGDITINEVKESNINNLKFVTTVKKGENKIPTLEIEDIKTIEDDRIKFENNEIVSKKNILMTNVKNSLNPKIIYFNDKKLENPTIYEIIYGEYMFRLVGDKTLYKNKKIRQLIEYLDNLDNIY